MDIDSLQYSEEEGVETDVVDMMRIEYAESLHTIQNMGFEGEETILYALQEHDGDVETSIQWLLNL